MLLMNLGKTLNQLILYANLAGLWPWWQHRDETGLCEAGRFVYILLIGVDISERCNILEIGNSTEELITETTYYLTGFI